MLGSLAMLGILFLCPHSSGTMAPKRANNTKTVTIALTGLSFNERVAIIDEALKNAKISSVPTTATATKRTRKSPESKTGSVSPAPVPGKTARTRRSGGDGETEERIVAMAETVALLERRARVGGDQSQIQSLREMILADLLAIPEPRRSEFIGNIVNNTTRSLIQRIKNTYDHTQRQASTSQAQAQAPPVNVALTADERAVVAALLQLKEGPAAAPVVAASGGAPTRRRRAAASSGCI
jgi:hypothetical protein